MIEYGVEWVIRKVFSGLKPLAIVDVALTVLQLSRLCVVGPSLDCGGAVWVHLANAGPE